MFCGKYNNWGLNVIIKFYRMVATHPAITACLFLGSIIGKLSGEDDVERRSVKLFSE